MRVLGRTEELAAIDAFLDELASVGSHPIRLITGELGIGKTVLWEEGRTRARHRGYTVLSARPAEPETALGFAALGDLFEGVPIEVTDALPVPQRRALGVALLRADPGETPPDPRSVATAVLGVLRALAAQGPVLLAIDDLGWLDAPTRRVLAFALRRVETELIGMLATVRIERGTHPGLPTDGLAPERLQQLTPGALSSGAVRELVADRLGFRPSHRLLVQIHETSAGNPYFALELARTLQQNDPHTANASGQLPVPPTLRRLVHGRIRRLAQPVRDVLLCAALAPGVAPDSVVAAATDPLRARGDLEAATAAGIVEVYPAEIAFTHPLLRSAVIDDASPRGRRAAHARLARTVEQPVDRARHLGLAAEGPDDAVAHALDLAAADARLRGATESAAELADLAIAMTTSTATDSLRRRTLNAADYHFDSGDPSQARRLLDGVVSAEPPGPERAGVLMQLARYQRHSGEALENWCATLDAALAEAGDHDLGLRLAIHFMLGFAAMNGGNPLTGPIHARAVTELAERLGDQFLNAQVAAGVAFLTYSTGGGLRHDLVERALAGASGIGRLTVEESPTYTVAVALGHAGELDRARRLLDRDWAETLEHGDEVSLPMLAWLLVRVETWAGDWPRAELVARQGMRAAELAANPLGIASVAGASAILHASQGRVADARAGAALALELGARTGMVFTGQMATEALGLLELSLGNQARAHAAMAQVVERIIEAGVVEPEMNRMLPLEIEALVRLRELDAARQLLDPFLERARRTGAGWAPATAGRCQGLLLAAANDLVAAEHVLGDAGRCSAELGMPFEHARTLLITGEVHRRARHRRLARESLTEAKMIFDRLGAPIWASRCADELVRTAGRTRPDAAPHPDDLTATELRVAELAAQGKTTREIAGTLFTGVRTVEAHLHHVYQKLGVRSRVELSLRLAGDPPAADA